MASGTTHARALAAVLRDARERAKVSAREVGRRLGVSHTTIRRWESGETAAGPEEVSAYLAVLGVIGDERDKILALARTRDESHWMISGPPGIAPQLASVMDCERTAKQITEWAPLVVPGLLQTGDYARHVIGRGSGDIPAPEIETRVMVRIARRDALTRRHPVRLHALIGEYVIRSGIGGSEVMADQLHHLTQAAQWDSVTLQVVRLTGEYHAGLAGPFILYEFADRPPVVYLEHHRSGAFLVHKADVAAYQTAAEEIRRAAMSPDQTAGLIADVIPSSSKETTE